MNCPLLKFEGREIYLQIQIILKPSILALLDRILFYRKEECLEKL